MKWLVLRAGGRKLPIHIVRDGHPKLEGANGIYLPDEGSIYLSRDLKGGVFEDTLFHEIDHAVNDIAGVTNLVSKLAKGANPDDVEEQMVRCRTPIWLELMKGLGFQFPKGPYE